MKEELKKVLRTAPLKTMCLLFIGWILMVIINYFINTHFFYNGTRLTFPMSVVYINQFSVTGFFFSFLFLIFGLLVVKQYQNLSKINLILSYFILIILGNLAQGSIHQSFLRSLLDTDFQYYHDVLKVTSGYDFISHYNENQETLTMHAKTHPPFSVWLHYIIWKIANYSPLGLAYGMSILGLTAIFPYMKILDFFKIKSNHKKILILLFALLPAVNIYSIVSIDAIFLMFSLWFLYGLLLIVDSKKINIKGIALVLLGFIGANMISFSGTFFACVAALVSFYQLIILKEKNTLYNFIIVGLCFLCFLGILYLGLNYNHIDAFFNASKSENPRGFRGFAEPAIYFFTRLENISEILLFLSFGFFAYLFQPKIFHFKKRQLNFILPIIALSTILLMFVTGAYATGETARACLFLYPYFIMLLFNIKDIQILKNITYIALFQTFFMQMLGDYFW